MPLFDLVAGCLYSRGPVYSSMELGVELMSLEPSSKFLRFVISPGGSEPGPDGDGRCRILLMPGDGARRGGVALPRPESVSVYRYTILSWSVLDPLDVL